VYVFTLLTYLFFFYLLDCYNFDYRFTSAHFLLRFISVPILASISIATTSFILNFRPFGVRFLVLQGLLIFFPAFFLRLALDAWYNKRRRTERVVVLGAGRTGRSILRLLVEKRQYLVIGFLDDSPKLHGTEVGGVQVLGGMERIPELVKAKQVDIFIVAILREMHHEVYRLLTEAKMQGVSVEVTPSFFEREAGKIPVRHVSNRWFVYMPIFGARKNLYNSKLKRLFDMGFALGGLCLLSPLLLLTAVAIRMDSPGPVFFLQKRIGLMGKPFQVVKFRSMRVGLEKERHFAGQRNDPRITRVGRVIRLFRIDELPQLWNVLKGEMSLIGPRALMEDEVQTFTPRIPYYALRHSLQPGITGWAQVNYPHGATEKDALEKLQYDLFYIKNLSFVLDFYIALKTIRTVVFWRGAR